MHVPATGLATPGRDEQARLKIRRRSEFGGLCSETGRRWSPGCFVTLGGEGRHGSRGERSQHPPSLWRPSFKLPATTGGRSVRR